MPVTAPTSSDGLQEASRAQLGVLAAERGISGRSRMTKDELRRALADGPRAAGAPAVSRVEQFRSLAEAAARDELVMLPRALHGDDRRLHVRQTLREDHETRIARNAGDLTVKFDEMARSCFLFFRGTALLFYRDMTGCDGWMPTVLTLGDVHPENFGVMPNADNVPTSGSTTSTSPTTPVHLGSEAGRGRLHDRRRPGRRVRPHAPGEDRPALRPRLRRGHPPLRRTRDRARGRDAHRQRAAAHRRALRGRRREARRVAADDYVEEFGRGFRADDELVPLTSRRAEFQDAIDRLVAKMRDPIPPRAAQMRVKDVAARMGQGTASLGLARYYVLIEGPRGDATDDLILELKQARRSALAGLVPPSSYEHRTLGDRIADAQAVQRVRGDVFYGSVELEGMSFMSRERAPYRDDIDLDDLSKGEWKRYAEICGGSLAHAHALSDEIGRVDHDIEPELLAAMTPTGLFVDDIVRYATEAADRVRTDHRAFCADHALGAFSRVDRVYR